MVAGTILTHSLPELFHVTGFRIPAMKMPAQLPIPRGHTEKIA